VGNANETREALAVLHGQGPDDLHACTMVLGEEMLMLAGRAKERGVARELIEDAIRTGAAARVMERMVAAQGGDSRVVAEPDRLVVAPGVPVVAASGGFVADVDPLEIGLAAVSLGAGRTRADQAVDPSVGIMVKAKPGAAVTPGSVLAVVETHDKAGAADVVERVRRAFKITAEAQRLPPLVLGRIAG